MQAAANQLKELYRQELAALRDTAGEFAQDYPEQAGMLGLNRGRSQDPQVELLMQSFAYLTGRLRHQLELDQAALPNALLDDLYPHLAAPLPSMLIAEFDVQPDGTARIERGRNLLADVQTEGGRSVVCRFRTCFDVDLCPLKVTELAVVSPEAYPGLTGNRETRSVLRVRLRRNAGGRQPIKQMPLDRLRLHLSPESGPAHALHALLSTHLCGMAVVENPERQAMPRALPENSFRWLGFDDEQAALLGHPQAHPAFRILQEYFAFSEKFLFFEIGSLGFSEAEETVDLLFLLDVPPNPAWRPSPAVLLTNCVPLVNLYNQRIDPLHLDHTRYEYRLTGDAAQSGSCEIYQLIRLQAVRAGAASREIAPYFSLDGFSQIEGQDYFYIARREPSQRPREGGTELFVSFLDSKFDIADPADDVIGGSAVCTNRRVPERLRVGDLLRIEGAESSAAVRVLSKPTAHQTPVMTGARPWQLVSQLSLNHLSLSGSADALAALKDILRLHVGPSSTLGHRAIDGIQSLRTRPLVRWQGDRGRRGYVHGLDIELTLDHTRFEDNSPVLFCEVLRHFFALYAAVNTVVQLSLRMPNVKGVVKQWPPLAGSQVLL